MFSADNRSNNGLSVSTRSIDDLQNEQTKSLNGNTFDAKRSYESFKKGFDLRSEKIKIKDHHHQQQHQNRTNNSSFDDEFDVWKVKPIDFNWKLYQPNPPKRNSRESIKPWRYDEYLRTTEIFPKTGSKVTRLPVKIHDDFNYFQTEKEKPKPFVSNIRSLTPTGAKIEAAKKMSYRDGLGQYTPRDTQIFRHLDSVEKLGLPDFQTRFEHDPYNLKFLKSNLGQIHGIGHSNLSRIMKPGVAQLGDAVKKADPKFETNLVLPKLDYPEQNQTYTRYRPLRRPPEDVYWDLVLDKLEDKLNQNSNPNSNKNIVNK